MAAILSFTCESVTENYSLTFQYNMPYCYDFTYLLNCYSSRTLDVRLEFEDHHHSKHNCIIDITDFDNHFPKSSSKKLSMSMEHRDTCRDFFGSGYVKPEVEHSLSFLHAHIQKLPMERT